MSTRHRAVLLAVLLSLALSACVTTTNTIGQATTIGHPGNMSDAANLNMQLGIRYLQQGDLAIAQQKLDRALSEDAHNGAIHGWLGILNERLGKNKDADREFRTALDLSPRDPFILNEYAVYLCSHERAAEGVRYFEQSATNPLYRTPWVAYTSAGVCLRQAHHDAEAAQRFARALQINPAYTEAVFQSSDLDLLQHHYADGRQRIDIYLLHSPATPDLLLLGWRLARAESNTDAQQRYAGRLAQEFPNSEQARSIANIRPDSG
jgi:type IV pilus assembly protein PilF